MVLNMVTQRIKVGPNLRLNVFDSAFQRKYPNDLTIVFIHGSAGCLFNWRYQLEYFSQRYRTVAYDWRGCGRSDKAQSYTFDDHYQDFLNLIKVLKIPPRPILVGHSYGCLIARRYISEHPVGKFINVSLGLSSIEKRYLKLLLKLPKFYQRFLYRSFFLFKNSFLMKKLLASQKTPVSIIRESLKNFQKPHLEFFLDLKTFYQNEPLDWLYSFQEEMLIVGGKEDKIFRPQSLEYLKQLVPQAKLEIIENAGHILPYETPKVFNQVVEAFIEAK